MTRLLTLIAACLIAGGCASNGLSDLDREISAALRKHQLENLGDQIGHDPNPVPAPVTGTALTDAAYDRNPPSNYPPADKLPTQRAGAGSSTAGAGAAKESDGPTFKFNLEEALAYAIEHSREYRNRKDLLFLATINLLTEQHLWGPRFFNDLTASATGTPEGGDHDHALSLINELRATQRLPYGGEVAVSAVVNLVQQLRTASTSVADDAQSADLKLAATIPLLRGAGKVAQEDLIQSHRSLVYAARDFEQFRGQFLVGIASDYFSLLLSQGEIRNLEGQVKNLEWLSSRVEALAAAGREPYFEVQRSQQQVLFARNNLLRSRELYENALDAFQVRLGMPTEQKLELAPTVIEVPLPAADNVSAVRTAWSYRLDLQTAHDLIDDARRKVEVARNQLLPQLDLFTDVTLRTDGSKKRGGADVDLGSSSYGVGVTYGAPLDRKTEALAHRTSIVALERTERAHSLLRDQIANDVKASIRAIELATFSLDLQARNLELAQKRRDGVVLRLRTLGPRDFIEAEDDLRQALDRRDAAIRDQRVSVLRYLQDTGQMRVNALGRWEAPGRLVDAPAAPQPPPAQRLMGPQEKPKE